MKKKHIPIIFFLLVITLSLTSCTPEQLTEKEYGFFSGLWHGFIFIFSLIGKMFGAKVGLYALHNTGFFYYLGFLFGLGVLGGGGGAASRRNRY
jgi:hypothetical protein